LSKLDVILQSCLEGLDSERLSVSECLRRHKDAAEALKPLLLTAERYRQAPIIRPSAAFREAARTRLLNLVAAAESKPSVIAPPRVSLWQSRGPLGALLRVGIALVVLIALVGGTGVVAQAASPDSALYPVKLALEEARLALALSEAERVELQLAIAERRALELVAMAGRGASSQLELVAKRHEAAVRAAVRAATRPGLPPSAVLSVEASLASQQQRLQEALTRMEGSGPEARASLGRALGVLERERTELPTRQGKEDATPSGSPPGPPERERDHGQGAAPASPPHRQPMPTATP